MSNLRDPFAPDSGVSGQNLPPQDASKPQPHHVLIRLPRTRLRSTAIGLSVALLATALITAEWWFYERPDAGPVDRRFVTIGRSYRNELAVVYAHAWDEGAKHLESGAGPDAALDSVAKAWDSGRVALFEQTLTPELSRIVPEGTATKDLSTVDRARLAAAWRGLARGLSAGR
jgi:hypothetical protein